ncbi:SixA phosphatase family protein [Thalassobellus suaedae]|uniref:Histidine phosphatase family protein n=1 Tax=Thalassobellus suaedae TaxID=3074124 RepID=A0ABY9Y2C8_9FLAO|nr:histidine phosphatase family protein [Flavobacteriaceae bacterium HL-DH10]
MKKLILVRHAKSSWKHNVIDHERPLNDRGVNDANLVSKALKSNLPDLDLLLSSDSIRTKTTVEIFIDNLGFTDEKVCFNHDLYDFEGRNLLRVIKDCEDSINNLMIFGHNHAITAFVNTYGNQFIDNVPTCGVVIIEFNIKNWKDLKAGKTLFTLFPKDLK